MIATATSSPAANMIRDGQAALIDGGTTNLRIASYLSRERSATIVTNSPPLALALADHPKLSVDARRKSS
jgi:DeoR/GlpR family transcriptional regulator of sugar metabolism